MSLRKYRQRNYQRRIRRTLRTNQNHIYSINNHSNTINRIVRIITPQITVSSFENSFFNGTSFNDNNSYASLILPAGFSGR